MPKYNKPIYRAIYKIQISIFCMTIFTKFVLPQRDVFLKIGKCPEIVGLIGSLISLSDPRALVWQLGINHHPKI